MIIEISIGFLALGAIVIYFLNLYSEQIVLEKIDEKVRPYLEKWKILKPRIEPKVTEKITERVIIIYKKTFENEIKTIDLKPEDYFIHKEKKELTTKNHKVKVFSKNKKILSLTQIAFANFVYPSVYELLDGNDVRTGFQLYFAYKNSMINKDSDTSTYIENAFGDNSPDNKTIKEWFDIFKKFDLEGDFLSIVLPISKEITTIDMEAKKEFTKFIREISKKDKFVQPFEIGKIKVGILRVARLSTLKKQDKAYYSYLAKLRNEGVNIIVLCGRGKWINFCKQLGDIAKSLYKLEIKNIETEYYSSMENLLEKKKDKDVLRILIKFK